MRSLFTLDSKMNVIIDPAAYMVRVYGDIWDRDKTKGKNKALKELAYIYFMSDYKCMYADISDEKERHRQVTHDINLGEYAPDKFILDAIKFYQKDYPISLRLLEDAKVGIDSLRKYFREADLIETNEKGALMHDAKKMVDNLKSLGMVVDSMSKLEEKVRRDIDTDYRVTGGREKGIFEDG